MPLTAQQKRERWSPIAMTCSWVKTEANTPPLCSACSGTPQDLAEAMVRGRRMLKQSGGLAVGLLIKINEAALARYRARQKRG